ncbi:c-type cytochrome [Phyllobacterium zundukense]|uniref:C-type cytochrome n=1 Tax=Phyllobacterium zundukense TaxID=1867719 RepID=A0ACD4D941_9HYPH|nr:c-type cytochrome [Phyllobacterium zundukense]UXN62269.1 c-type cytochrome [Phyllobacterium zundukense]
MRPRFVLVTALAGLLIAVVSAWSGLFNVAASSGHFKITAWFLHYVMRQSVKTHSIGIVPPDLNDPVLIRRGGAHFETACVYCHGSPLADGSPVARQMTPAPPQLGHTLDTWKSAELFWIVKHGIKYTGMPAWPAQDRDDEVWAVVAFLEVLSTMSAASYREIAFGTESEHIAVPADLPQSKGCTRCHGQDGKGDDIEAFPRLDIQSERYLGAALQSYVHGRRQSGIMEAAVSGLTPGDIEALARYYRAPAEPGQAQHQSADDATVLKGQKIAREGIAEKQIPACNSCHQPEGNTPNFRPDFPRLAGQNRRFLIDQLHLFAAEKDRGGTAFAGLMAPFAHKLDNEDIHAVAAWYASLPASRN